MENAGEVHMSLRGSMETKDWTDNNTKILSRRAFGHIENTARYKEAEDQLLNVMEYAQRVGEKLTISGHNNASINATDGIVSKYSYKYGSKYYPLAPVNLIGDSTLALENIFSGFELDGHNVPMFATRHLTTTMLKKFIISRCCRLTRLLGFTRY